MSDSIENDSETQDVQTRILEMGLSIKAVDLELKQRELRKCTSLFSRINISAVGKKEVKSIFFPYCQQME